MAKAFDYNQTQALANSIANLLNDSNLSAVEMAYALASALRGVGEALYDKTDVSFESVFADYRISPTWAAALIIHADQVHKIYELFSQERRDPSVNEEAWKAFGDKLNDGTE